MVKITFETEQWLKEQLEEMARINDFSIDEILNQLILSYIYNPRPGQITIKGEDIVDAAKLVATEGIEKAVKLDIYQKENQGEDYIFCTKHLSVDILECGVCGMIAGEIYDEITPEELEEIP